MHYRIYSQYHLMREKRFFFMVLMVSSGGGGDGGGGVPPRPLFGSGTVLQMFVSLAALTEDVKTCAY